MGCVQNWPPGGESVVEGLDLSPQKVRLVILVNYELARGQTLRSGGQIRVENRVALHAILDPIQIFYKIFVSA